MIKTFKLKYTELIGEDEMQSEMLIKTKDIQRTLEQFMRNRTVVKIDAKQLNIKQ